MKMTKEHFEDLRNRINSNLTLASVLQYRDYLQTDSRVRDLDTRLRWDIYYAVTRGNYAETTDLYYKYLNDRHIDTALKHIMRELYNL